jgi:hypothetical protein
LGFLAGLQSGQIWIVCNLLNQKESFLKAQQTREDLGTPYLRREVIELRARQWKELSRESPDATSFPGQVKKDGDVHDRIG